MPTLPDPNSQIGGNIQGTTLPNSNGGGLGGALQTIMSGSGGSIAGPSSSAYGQQNINEQNQGQMYNGMAQSFNQTAPTAQNPYQANSQAGLAQTQGNLGGILGQYTNIINSGGMNTPAQTELQHNLQTSQAQQIALANSAQGGAAAQAGARRQAQAQGAMMGAQNVATSRQIANQQVGNALTGAAGVVGQQGNLQAGQYGIEQGAAVNNANVAQANQGQINQTQLGLYGAASGAVGNELNTLNGYTTAQNEATAQQQAEKANTNKTAGNVISGAVKLASAIL